MTSPTLDLAKLIEELRVVLEEERRALLSGTAEAISAVSQRKMLLAELVEQATAAAASASRPSADVLLPLMRYNQENAVICDAMLRHLTASSDRLRRQDPHRSYGSDGAEHRSSTSHALGAA